LTPAPLVEGEKGRERSDGKREERAKMRERKGGRDAKGRGRRERRWNATTKVIICTAPADFCTLKR